MRKLSDQVDFFVDFLHIFIAFVKLISDSHTMIHRISLHVNRQTEMGLRSIFQGRTLLAILVTLATLETV